MRDQRAQLAVRDRAFDAAPDLFQAQVKNVAAGFEHARRGEVLADCAEHAARHAEGARATETHGLPRLYRRERAAARQGEERALHGREPLAQDFLDALFGGNTIDRRRAVRERGLQHVEQHTGVLAQIRLLELELVLAPVGEVGDIALDFGNEFLLAARAHRGIRFARRRLAEELLDFRLGAHQLGERSHAVHRLHRLDAFHAADRRHFEPVRRVRNPALDEPPDQTIGKPDGGFERDHHAPAREQLRLETHVMAIHGIGGHGSVI